MHFLAWGNQRPDSYKAITLTAFEIGALASFGYGSLSGEKIIFNHG